MAAASGQRRLLVKAAKSSAPGSCLQGVDPAHSRELILCPKHERKELGLSQSRPCAGKRKLMPARVWEGNVPEGFSGFNAPNS